MFKQLKYCLIFLFISFPLWGQENIEVQLRNNRNQLEKIKSQINNLQDEISKSNIKSANLVKQISFIDEEMGMIAEVKRLLYTKNKLLEKKIASQKAQLKEKNENLNRLRKLYENRVTNLYKHGRVKNFELLVNARSLNQALVRYKYLKFFAEQELVTINYIKNEIQQIEQLNKDLDATLVSQKNNLQIKEKEESRYIANRDKKNILLKKIKWSKNSLTKQLTDAEDNYKKLNSIIAALEKKRKEREQSKTVKPTYALNLKDFNKAKGKLGWPVSGQVITKYGKQKNTVLKTYVNNTGIDIKAKTGEEVKAVFQGLVSMITYLGGYGNTVIIDHGEGYYTVYSHLSDILLDEDQYVRAGDTVGLVGDSGSLDGAKLHFEIYAKEQTVDPIKWLK